MATKGVIVFRGDSGNPTTHYSKTQVEGVTDDTALGTLATALAGYSDANMAKRSHITNTAGTDASPGTGANVDWKGIIYFRDSSDLSVHSVTIPAIKATSVDSQPEGDRVLAATVTAVTAAIATATGKTLTGLYGVVIQKR